MARIASASSTVARRMETSSATPLAWPFPRVRGREPAPLAQSAERFHGKEKVVSSILTGGSQARSRRRSSVGQSTRLIIELSWDRSPPPLPPARQDTKEQDRCRGTRSE